MVGFPAPPTLGPREGSWAPLQGPGGRDQRAVEGGGRTGASRGCTPGAPAGSGVGLGEEEPLMAPLVFPKSHTTGWLGLWNEETRSTQGLSCWGQGGG